MVFQACPISGDSRNERVARVVAAFVIAIVVAAVVLGPPWAGVILLLLALDFAVRGFGSARRSPLATLARGLANTLRLTPKPDGTMIPVSIMAANARPHPPAAGIKIRYLLISSIPHVILNSSQ